MYRASSGAWGHRAVYIGAVVATAAVIAGFGAALVVYGPLGSAYRQSSATTSPAAPTGVTYGTAQQVFASSLVLTNASASDVLADGAWNWSAGGPCNYSGLLNPLSTSSAYSYYDTNTSAGEFNVTAGNTTLICLNSVGTVNDAPATGGAVTGTFGGGLNATWLYNATGVPLVSQTWSAGGIPNGAVYDSAVQEVEACNNFSSSALLGLQWNQTHILNTTTLDPQSECSSFYQMDNNTNITPSFAGFANSTEWAPNQSGYAPGDVVYEIPVNFDNFAHNGTYQVSVSIGGVTPVAQTFFVNSSTYDPTCASACNGTLLFTFDLTAAWLYDTSFNYSAVPTPTTTPEIYGAIGVVSAIVTECQTNAQGYGVCPNTSSALVASEYT